MTDDKLKQDVNAELKWDTSLHAAEIGVEVKDGIVTLVGQVSSYTEKMHAEQAAQRVKGVQALAVKLEVNLPGDCRRDDAQIARTAKNVLDWVSIIPVDSIHVLVEDGWITLSGNVEWQYQRLAAKAAVQYLMGVRGVNNLVSIKPHISTDAVKTDIEAALQRSAHNDAQNIRVEVHGSDVTLSGKVHSWSERNLARQSAWNSPGVRAVVDNIDVIL